MKYTTTLNAIHSHNPCGRGWKTLLEALGPDYGDDTPIPLARIVETNGVSDALWALRTQSLEDAKAVAVPFSKNCAERAKQYADAVADAAAVEHAERVWQKADLIKLLTED